MWQVLTRSSSSPLVLRSHPRLPLKGPQWVGWRILFCYIRQPWGFGHQNWGLISACFVLLWYNLRQSLLEIQSMFYGWLYPVILQTQICFFSCLPGPHDQLFCCSDLMPFFRFEQLWFWALAWMPWVIKLLYLEHSALRGAKQSWFTNQKAATGLHCLKPDFFFPESIVKRRDRSFPHCWAVKCPPHQSVVMFKINYFCSCCLLLLSAAIRLAS